MPQRALKVTRVREYARPYQSSDVGASRVQPAQSPSPRQITFKPGTEWTQRQRTRDEFHQRKIMQEVDEEVAHE